jgi:hypothetical protein
MVAFYSALISRSLMPSDGRGPDALSLCLCRGLHLAESPSRDSGRGPSWSRCPSLPIGNGKLVCACGLTYSPPVVPPIRQLARMGFMIFRPAKCFSFFVTMTQSFASANRGNDPVERASWPPFRRPLGHQMGPNEAGPLVEYQHPPSEQRLGTVGARKNQRSNPLRFLPAGFSKIPRWISATVSEEINRFSSACSAIHASRASDGTGLVTLLMILVSWRLRLTGPACVPVSPAV